MDEFTYGFNTGHRNSVTLLYFMGWWFGWYVGMVERLYV
jgi:hypothetical protein